MNHLSKNILGRLFVGFLFLNVAVAHADCIKATLKKGKVLLKVVPASASGKCGSGSISTVAGATGAAGPVGATGPVGPTGSSGTIAVTTFANGSSPSLIAPGDFSFHDLGSIATITKQSAATGLFIDISSPILVSRPSGVTYCSFQIRIDGADATGSTSTTFSSVPSGMYTSVNASAVQTISGMFIRGYFPNISAGAHTLSLFVRSSTTDGTCGLNAGGFRTQAVVTEVLPAT